MSFLETLDQSVDRDAALRYISEVCKSDVTDVVDEGDCDLTVGLTPAQYSIGVHSLYTKYGDPTVKHYVGGVLYVWKVNASRVTFSQWTKESQPYKMRIAVEGSK